jgi:nicotinate phosphoribosyltransferase
MPVTGTAAHAFTLSYPTEREAFQAQIDAMGPDTTLLVDTYDIAEGIRTAVEVAGTELGGIRIDSGDLIEETFKARQLLDSLGATETKIILSSDIDEYSLFDLYEAGAPVDGAGVGTRFVAGSGAPAAGLVYKLVERMGEDGRMIPVSKRAEGKVSIGGAKKIYREYDERGRPVREILTAQNVSLPESDYRRMDQSLVSGGQLNYFYTDGSLAAARANHAEAKKPLHEADIFPHHPKPVLVKTEYIGLDA